MTQSTQTNTNLLVVTALVVSLGLTACLEPEHTPPDPIECGDPGLYVSVHDTCEPMEAMGDEACYCMLGYAWTGSGCEAVTGCECTGVDCVSLTESEQECIDIHESCVEEPPVDDPCDPMDAEGDELCFMFLGYAWDGSECVVLGGCECTGEDCDELYEELDECIADNEECVEEPPVEDPCDPMDAEGDGLCYLFLGYAWDGGECVIVGGCECTGEDCDELYEELDECMANTESCIEEPPVVEPCAPMDAEGEGLCYGEFGYAWNGDECVIVGGCECLGEDCFLLYDNEEECIADNEACIEEPPVDEPLECGDDALYSQTHDSCEAMDAVGQGACYCAMGFAWNGSECFSLSGSCECVGEDCDSIYVTEEECVAAHESC